jgi:hypothetical protein
MTLLFRPPRPARPVPGMRRSTAYAIAMEPRPNGPIAELLKDLAPSNGQDFAPVFDEDDPEAGPFVMMDLEMQIRG